MILKNKILETLESYGFHLEEIPKDKYHKGVNVKYLEMRGKIITKKTDPIKFESADHVFVSDGENIYVIRNIYDFLGQMASVKAYQETNEEQAEIIEKQRKEIIKLKKRSK